VPRVSGVQRQILVFDADDTLWENNVLFERVVHDYLEWLAHPTLDRAALREVLDDVERATIAVQGYGSASFLHSLHVCFERLQRRAATDAERAEITGLAAALVDNDVELMPGVADALAQLATRHELLLLTKGQAAEQQRKIDASGLAHHFRSTHVVAEKVPATYRDLVAEQRLAADTTWMIGNSPRSDILAARAAGLRAVFIPHPYTWSLEEQEIDPGDQGVLHLARFPDLLDHF
jgi:putative hydrolase of the HAD superfamily